MRIASIDIGTNTVLLLVADISDDGMISPVAHEQRFPRLGKDVDERKVISISAFDRIGWILNEFKNLAKQYRAEHLVAAATSAVRDASNASEFTAYLESSTGVHVEVLSGTEEALWSYRGAASSFPGSERPVAVIDIGGGSTEITFPDPRGHNGNAGLHHFSLQIGAVRLTERYLKHSPPLRGELESARQHIAEEFAQLKNPGLQNYLLVGVAGTITTLACLDLELKEFDIAKVGGYTLKSESVSRWLQRLASMELPDIQQLSFATEGRADILTAGVLILHEFLNHFTLRSVTTSERGLRYGLVLREWRKNTH